MRTIAYVDGFNLYFGALRRTPHRWLNLQRLLELHLKPHNQIVSIKYCTAKLNLRPNDPDVPPLAADVSGLIFELLDWWNTKATGLSSVLSSADSTLPVRAHLSLCRWQERMVCAVVTERELSLDVSG